MAIYQVTDNEIKTISRTTFSETGLKEREDLQRLLKHQIEIISPDTLVVAEEFGEWDESRRHIDLLGIDKQANIVVRVSRDPELIYDNNEYYVARNWGKESAEAFANKVTSNFPSITYKLHTD